MLCMIISMTITLSWNKYQLIRPTIKSPSRTMPPILDLTSFLEYMTFSSTKQDTGPLSPRAQTIKLVLSFQTTSMLTQIESFSLLRQSVHLYGTVLKLQWSLVMVIMSGQNKRFHTMTLCSQQTTSQRIEQKNRLLICMIFTMVTTRSTITYSRCSLTQPQKT